MVSSAGRAFDAAELEGGEPWREGIGSAPSESITSIGKAVAQLDSAYTSLSIWLHFASVRSRFTTTSIVLFFSATILLSAGEKEMVCGGGKTTSS
jgi:hypothetical protein